MADSRAWSSALGQCPTSLPYRAAGMIMVLIVSSRCVWVSGRCASLLTHWVALCNLPARVELWLVWSMVTWAPRSRKWLTTFMLMCVVGWCWGLVVVVAASALSTLGVPRARPLPLTPGTSLMVACLFVLWMVRGACMVAHLIERSLALVAGQVEVTKHLLSATLAPTSAKYCLVMFMPWTIRDACCCLLVERKRSSARTLGSTLLALMVEIQGLMSRATSAMEKGHPCGMEHLCWCGLPMVEPIWLCITRVVWNASYANMMLVGMPAALASATTSGLTSWSKHL